MLLMSDMHITPAAVFDRREFATYLPQPPLLSYACGMLVDKANENRFRFVEIKIFFFTSATSGFSLKNQLQLPYI
jgi:hypothetical protein